MTTEISLRGSIPTSSPRSVPTTCTGVTHISQASPTTTGKAPPLDSFTGTDPELRLDDWIPALLRASKWYSWSENKELIQLAGHLRGRALRQKAVKALRERLNPGGKALAAQDFLHTAQKGNKSVADYIRHLECMFHCEDKRRTMLHRGIQTGLPTCSSQNL